MQRVLILALWCAAAVFPQETWPLKQIKIDGNRVFTDEQLITASGLTTGGQYTRETLKERLDKAQAELLVSGVVESVAYLFGPTSDGSGYVVSFEVSEIEQAYPITFENIEFPDEAIHAWLKQKDPLYTARIPGTETQILRYAKFIEEFLKENGKPEEIRGEVASDRPGELVVMFHPKGAMPVIATVDFEGNDVVSTEQLRSVINGVATGTRYTEGRFRTLLTANILPIYYLRGRINTTFPEIRKERAAGDVNGIRVIVKVDEGESFSFGVVRVQGTASMDSELLAASELRPGDVANLKEIPAAMERIKAALASQGYMAATAAEEHEIVKEKGKVDVVISVDPGPKYKMGELALVGLDLHGEHEIEKVWGMKPGDPFDPTYPDFFLERIKEIKLFDGLRKTDKKFEQDDRTRTVNVTLYFNPRERKARFGGDDPLEDQPRRRK